MILVNVSLQTCTLSASSIDFGDDDLVLFFSQQANADYIAINDSINWVDGSYAIFFCDGPMICNY